MSQTLAASRTRKETAHDNGRGTPRPTSPPSAASSP